MVLTYTRVKETSFLMNKLITNIYLIFFRISFLNKDMELNKRPVKAFRKSKVFGTVPIKSALFLGLTLSLNKASV